MKTGGQPIVDPVASTSGTDSDWVVKVIDLDRDPRTFVQNILWAKPQGYKKPTQRIFIAAITRVCRVAGGCEARRSSICAF
ncbi:MAG TPA: hypothetical protein VMB25_23695 [Bryobacteraceae bacterium]|nr:hypothetical protein [Bryobacteraceae bacterium]